ncbi:MAG: hypothetical protein GYB37_01715 [Algicola sp.]|nr:hypothetical protein [Algicola sp.]
MKIIWKSSEVNKALNHLQRVELEYAVRLQVVKILISEAEHLMDYLSLVVMQINPSNGHVSVHEETPEPLFSKISNNLEQPKPKKVAKVSSSLLAIANF